ncbi:filament-like plant protein 7 [Salvia miltiorrhiza]|uniref:filament-like plant protein 7 n=1 Tax=Salvia miltiorrhiza TaxID=226208 RepID=UPI0025ACC750|nr:filament-like plant protein 7 [Salvia miltiorrhiza]XP_057767090.1 filament-like plant protein 7 [Salvia miltiorrhiza]XP_057767091.1 filament-like plant protein 7 [Salvia miltiorrhiza]
MAGWEKGKRDAISLKKDLDNTLQQKTASEERIRHLDAALKECMQQLHYVREDQERRIHGAVIKTSEEFEKQRTALNGKLAETGKRIARLESENSQLRNSLSSKEKTIQDLSKYTTQVEADLHALVLRVDSSEKEKASLSYEFRVLEKELDIRNEETEFNRRTADIAQKQHQESMKKVAKLESECQRLRLLVRRRLPGPAALTKMKNEVEMLGKDQAGTRRKRSNYYMISSADFHVDDAAAETRINLLTEQLLRMEEQNRSLQYALNKKSSQSQFSSNTYDRAASRSSQGDAQDGVFKKEQLLAALSDLGSDDKDSCAESWAPELEHYRNEKQSGTPSNRYMETPEMNLLNDFAEMEKLAIVSIDYPATSSHHSSEEGNGPSGGHLLPIVASEMVPVNSNGSEALASDQDIQSETTSADRFPKRLDDLLKMLLEYCKALKISPREVLEDMKAALKHNSSDSMYFNKKCSRSHLDATTHSPKVSRQASNKSFNLEQASDTGIANDISTANETDRKLESNVSIQISKILELLEGINILPQDNGVAEDDKRLPYKSLTTATGYMVRVFQWKSAELSEVLQQIFQTCNELLNGKANLEQFVQIVASTLDWVMNHCFSLQDVSSMKDAMRSRLEWDESRSESDFDSGVSIQREEAKKLIIEPANTDLSTSDFQGRAQSPIFKAESFENQPEKEAALQSMGNIGDQIKKGKMTEDLETNFMDGNHEQINTCEKISCPKTDLEDKSNSVERREETCSNQVTRPKSKRSNGGEDDGKPCEKQLRDDWEISVASEKLAECQETIINLGKQLKALALPRDAAMFDTVVHTPADYVITSTPTTTRILSKRLSLLDNMLAEDSDQIGSSPTTTDHIQNGNSNSTVSTNAASESWSKFMDPDGIKGEVNIKANVSMAIVPRKKKEGRNFLKKLFMWQKKGDRKKTLFS